MSNSKTKEDDTGKVCCRKNKCCRKNARNDDGTITLQNHYIYEMESDYLYHLNLGTATHDLVKMFGDVKFVCMGGTASRMKNFAHYIKDYLKVELPTGTDLIDISASSNRYSLYKVGPVISVNHGIGISTMGVLLHELIKLMYHAKCKNPIFIRMGTCGGVGIEGGTIVVSNGAVDGMLKEHYELPILGKLVSRPAILDEQLSLEIKSLAPEDCKVVLGKTMGALDFYEGQGRIDGAFCDYEESDKMEFLHKLSENGVVNIEMEAPALAAFTHHAGIKCAIVNVALLNRLNGDQVLASKDDIHKWESQVQELVGRFIKKRLNM